MGWRKRLALVFVLSASLVGALGATLKRGTISDTIDLQLVSASSDIAIVPPATGEWKVDALSVLNLNSSATDTTITMATYTAGGSTETTQDVTQPGIAQNNVGSYAIPTDSTIPEAGMMRIDMCKSGNTCIYIATISRFK
jgi:hypothetical protein